MDVQTFADIEQYGRYRWLDELAEDLWKKTYAAAGLECRLSLRESPDFRGAKGNYPGHSRPVAVYQPQAVRRVWIPKPNGKQRPLGIPTIRDRAVQFGTRSHFPPQYRVVRKSLAANTPPHAICAGDWRDSTAEWHQVSPVSSMPKGLLNTLLPDDILDLLTYLEACGRPLSK